MRGARHDELAEARSRFLSPLLYIERLSRSFGERTVIRGLDLALEAGERVALRGPNGSGKSTALRCAAGSLAPTSGSVLVGGLEPRSLQARRLIGVSLSQDRSFYLRLSGRENLIFFARTRGHSLLEAERAAGDLSDELELGDFLGERTDTYSTGMILQLAVARALLDDPPLLLLDEPTRSLDAAAVQRLWRALDGRRTSALLIATHREDDVEHCDSTVEFPR